ncbi:hypothetical protein D9M68_832160 [compost metagenome]
MNSSTLEITEKEYCIKLNRDTFDLSLVRQLIKRIQAEELFFSRKANFEEDMVSRDRERESCSFDHLDDK